MNGIRPKLTVALTEEQRLVLEDRSRRRVAPYCEVQRARALIMAADGARSVEIASRLDVDARTVSIWRKEFLDRGLDSLCDRPRPGAPRSFSP